MEAGGLSNGLGRIDHLIEELGNKPSADIAREATVYLTVTGFDDGSGEFLSSEVPVLTDELLESLRRTRAKVLSRLKEIGVEDAAIDSAAE